MNQRTLYYPKPYEIMKMNYFGIPGIARNTSNEFILQCVSQEFGIEEQVMLSKKRIQPSCEARHVAMYFLRKRNKVTLVDIGKMFDRDHTTVMHAVHKIKELLSVGDRIQNHITNIEERLNLIYYQPK